MMKNIQIRPLSIGDYDTLYTLWRSVPGMGLNDLDDSQEGIDRYLKRNPNTSFAAILEGKLAGAILSGHDGRRGYISHTAVSPDCQRMGIGTALVSAAMAALEAEEIHKVNLVAFARNTAGNAFWEKQGFTVRENLVYRNKNIHPLKRIDT